MKPRPNLPISFRKSAKSAQKSSKAAITRLRASHRRPTRLPSPICSHRTIASSTTSTRTLTRTQAWPYNNLPTRLIRRILKLTQLLAEVCFQNINFLTRKELNFIKIKNRRVWRCVQRKVEDQ